jgi:hypothetical protein
VFINRDSEKIVTAAVPLAFAAFSGLALPEKTPGTFSVSRADQVMRMDL